MTNPRALFFFKDESPHVFASQARLCTCVFDNSCRDNHLRKHLQVTGRAVIVVQVAGVQGTIAVIKHVIAGEKKRGKKREYAIFLMTEGKKKNHECHNTVKKKMTILKNVLLTYKFLCTVDCLCIVQVPHGLQKLWHNNTRCSFNQFEPTELASLMA